MGSEGWSQLFEAESAFFEEETIGNDLKEIEKLKNMEQEKEMENNDDKCCGSGYECYVFWSAFGCWTPKCWLKSIKNAAKRWNFFEIYWNFIKKGKTPVFSVRESTPKYCLMRLGVNN